MQSKGMINWIGGFLVAAGALGHVGSAYGGDATLGFSAPNNTFKKTVTVKITYPDGSVYPVNATIEPGDTAIQKRNRIADAIDAHANPDWRVTRDPNEAVLTIKDLPKDAVVEFDPGQTGEAADRVVVPKLIVGSLGYIGPFEPFDYAGLPAVFTAGLVTDVGELAVEVSAAELNFQTEGPIICQALFQRLAPRAPAYGAQLLYAGDRLEVYFDPAYSVSAGGVVFGTTSPGPGGFGAARIPEGPDCNSNGVPDEVDLALGTSADCNQNFVLDECDIAVGTSADTNGNGVPDECELPSVCAGDANCDGLVNWRDIDYLIAAQNDNQSAWAALFPAPGPSCLFANVDASGDDHVNWRDIDPFIARMNTTCP